MIRRLASHDLVVTLWAFIGILSVASSFSIPSIHHPGIVSRQSPSLTKRQATVEETSGTAADVTADSSTENELEAPTCDLPIFSNVMAANRAEIAVRIMRAATELNAGTVAIYSYEDRYSQHRWGADRSFMLDKAEDATPISAYLDIPQIIQIAKDAHVGTFIECGISFVLHFALLLLLISLPFLIPQFCSAPRTR